jgi:protein-disulfide isomerase
LKTLWTALADIESRVMIARIVLLLLVLSVAAQAQQGGSAQFPIKDGSGEPMANHGLSAEQMAQVVRLPGLVQVSGAKPSKPGDVTLYQFYDLNCPFCREAAADIDKLMGSDPTLRLVLVPYPVLSMQSIEGARVELALREIGTPQQFLEFHRKIYATRGVIDGNRALAVAETMGFDRERIIDVANRKSITETMTAHARLGTALKLNATPSYVIQGIAILGHPGLEPLRKVVASVRLCKAVVC